MLSNIIVNPVLLRIISKQCKKIEGRQSKKAERDLPYRLNYFKAFYGRGGFHKVEGVVSDGVSSDLSSLISEINGPFR